MLVYRMYSRLVDRHGARQVAAFPSRGGSLDVVVANALIWPVRKHTNQQRDKPHDKAQQYREGRGRAMNTLPVDHHYRAPERRLKLGLLTQ